MKGVAIHTTWLLTALLSVVMQPAAPQAQGEPAHLRVPNLTNPASADLIPSVDTPPAHPFVAYMLDVEEEVMSHVHSTPAWTRVTAPYMDTDVYIHASIVWVDVWTAPQHALHAGPYINLDPSLPDESRLSANLPHHEGFRLTLFW